MGSVFLIMSKEKRENKNFLYDYPRKINFKYFLKFIFVKIENLFYRICFILAARKSLDKKYRVSVCTIFKDEAPYLKEWIEYHKIIGVDHFYLYNNNSSDDFMKIITPYIKKGVVTLIDWPMQQGQIKAYKDCIRKYRHESNWIGFIDVDEFIVPIKENDVYSFLKKFKNRPAVKLYWQLFGTSGRVDRVRTGLVTEDFTICWRKYDEVGKCFYNTAYDFNFNSPKAKGMHHFFWASWKGIDLPPVNCFDSICQRGFERAKSEDFPIQLNHYFTKSFNEYIERMTRGDVFFKVSPRNNINYFYRHELLCTKKDYSVYKYLIKLKLAMKEK